MDTITATAANVTFNAPLANESVGGTVVQTLQAEDTLTGLAGTNVLKATLNDNAEAPILENIQNLFLTSRNNNAKLDLTNANAVAQVWNTGSTNNLAVEGVQNTVVIGLQDVRAGDMALKYDTTKNVTAQTIVANGTRDEIGVNVDGSAALTSTTLVVTADSEIALGAGFDDVRTLTISGSGDLGLTQVAGFEDVRTVSAGTMTGDLTLDISGTDKVTGATRLASVTTGSGDDTVVIASEQFVTRAITTDTLKVDLGAGENTLIVAGALKATDITALKFKGAGLSLLGVSSLAVGGVIDLDADATLNTDGIAPTELIFIGDVDGANTLTLSKFAGTAITFEGEVGDTGAVSLTGADIAGTLILTTEEDASFGALTFAKATSLTINAEADVTVGTDLAAAKITTLTISGNDAISTIDVGTIKAADLATIIASGKSDFTAVIDATTTKVTTIDLSGLEGKADLTSTASKFAGVVTILIGEGNVDADLQTTAADAKREIFQFVGDDIGAIEITGFIVSSGGNGDKLDFSQFAGVTSSDDLVITLNAGNSEITSDAFDGTITVVGVDLTVATASNFLMF